MNRALIVLGAFLVILGLGWSWFRHVPLFRLPGDIVIDRPGFKFFLPITTMLLISALISILRNGTLSGTSNATIDCGGRMLASLT